MFLENTLQVSAIVFCLLVEFAEAVALIATKLTRLFGGIVRRRDEGNFSPKTRLHKTLTARPFPAGKSVRLKKTKSAAPDGRSSSGRRLRPKDLRDYIKCAPSECSNVATEKIGYVDCFNHPNRQNSMRLLRFRHLFLLFGKRLFCLTVIKKKKNGRPRFPNLKYRRGEGDLNAPPFFVFKGRWSF